LREEINNRREIPSIEEIKGVIIGRVNSTISTGKINDIYIMQFLAV
jgi:hypothetical protein